LRRDKPARLVVVTAGRSTAEHPTLAAAWTRAQSHEVKTGRGAAPITTGSTTAKNRPQTGLKGCATGCKRGESAAEKLSNVDLPSWAPAAWREICQLAAAMSECTSSVLLIDKIFCTSSTIHVGPLREYRHPQAVAQSMDVPVEKNHRASKFF
jgi:hypothetical protein